MTGPSPTDKRTVDGKMDRAMNRQNDSLTKATKLSVCIFLITAFIFYMENLTHTCLAVVAGISWNTAASVSIDQVTAYSAI